MFVHHHITTENFDTRLLFTGLGHLVCQIRAALSTHEYRIKKSQERMWLMFCTDLLTLFEQSFHRLYCYYESWGSSMEWGLTGRVSHWGQTLESYSQACFRVCSLLPSSCPVNGHHHESHLNQWCLSTWKFSESVGQNNPLFP